MFVSVILPDIRILHIQYSLTYKKSSLKYQRHFSILSYIKIKALCQKCDFNSHVILDHPSYL